MDFGAVGLDNFLSSNSNNGSAFASESDADVIKHRLYGSGFLKQESPVDEDDLRAFKLPKTPCPKHPCNNNTPSLSEHQQQMLSFSSPNSQMLSFSSHSSQSMAFPFYPHASTAISRSSGYGSVNTASMNAMLSGVRGPFTPSQWMELEHQALIYKYITANVPIPSYLLNPIRKALESSGFSCFLKPNALGWGAFHLGFSNTDPEPGRCRRTDGKKWRCSRDAVPDQKYCERHINRGRHRSRKPVEPQPGHSDKLNNVQPRTNDHLSGKASIDRSVVEKENANGAYQHTKMCIKDNQQSGYTESSRPEFGSVCSDSLLNPLNRSSSLVNTRNYTECDSKSEHVLRQFIDDHYPKSQSARLPVSWPDADRTQLSISIPTVTSEFMSSSSSPANEKRKASPSRLSREVEATQMGLGIGAITNEQSQRQNGWVPISWEPSIGGPLGEALHTTSECKNSKALNLIENWDHSPRLGPSSFGVIPTVESTKTTLDGASLYNGLVGPGLMLPSLPAL